MTRTATAIAHPNIALAKYWGKRRGEGNIPAVPSLSVTLAGMSTTTTVSFDATLVPESRGATAVVAMRRDLLGALAAAHLPERLANA